MKSSKEIDWGCYACKKWWKVHEGTIVEECQFCKKSFLQYDKIDGVVSNLFCPIKVEHGKHELNFLGGCIICGFLKFGLDQCPKCDNQDFFCRLTNVNQMSIWNIRYRVYVFETIGQRKDIENLKTKGKTVLDEDRFGNIQVLKWGN